MKSPGAERNAIIVVNAGFLLAGVVTTLLGPILPILIERWSMNDEHAGRFFALQFAGSVTGTFLLGALIPRRGYGTTLSIGFAFMAIGVAWLNFGSELTGLAATFLFGCGLGVTLSGTNLWIADIAGEKRAAALNLSNLVWGIGAIACPGLVLLANRNGRISVFLLGVATCAAVVAVALALMEIEPQLRAQTEPARPPANPKVPILVASALVALMYLYVGTENSMNGWLAAFARRMEMRQGSRWELAPMLFWTGLLSGRALAPAILRQMREKSVLFFGLSLAATCNAALLWATTLRAAAPWVILDGFGLATIYPLLVASLVRHFGERLKGAASGLFVFAALGGATLPWAVGIISTRAGNLRFGLVLPLAACVIMIGLLPLLREQG